MCIRDRAEHEVRRHQDSRATELPDAASVSYTHLDVYKRQAQQNAPAEIMAPDGKSDQIKAPEKAGQAAPTASESDSKQQTTDKGAPASVAAKGSADADGSTAVKSKRVERHVGARYASGYRGPLFDSYRGDHGYRDCRGHRHGWMPWLWC